MAVGIAKGSTQLPLLSVLLSLKAGVFSQPLDASVAPNVFDIVWKLRLPRVLLAFFVGGGLSIVGVAMQTLVRNPLAEPYILGISSGASAGASLFYLGFLPPVLSLALTLPLAAFAGSLLTMLVV